MFYVTALVLLCVARCSSAVKSTCEVNITNDQQSFALLTCRFSEPVKDFLLELKRPADSNKQSLGMCSSKSCVGPNTTNYILIPNKEESFHGASLGILSGADSPEGTYSCVPMDESHPNPDVHACQLSSWKRSTGISLTSSCNADARDELQVEVTCTFSNPVRYFQVDLIDGPDSRPDPVAVCTPEGCRSKGNRYRVINPSSDLRSVVMARDPKEASKQRKFRCRPFVTEDAFRAESCAVLTSLTSLITKNVSSEHTSPAVRLSTCTVEVAEEGAVHVLSCSFPSETSSYLVELSFSTGSGLEVQCTRNQCNSSASYVFTPSSQKDNNSQVEVRIELPRQQRAGWVEYRCVPHDVSQVQTIGCRANFSQPPVTSEVSTTDKVPRKETNITGNKETHFDALVHIIVTGCFIGITTIAVVVVLAVGIHLLRRRVYDKQQWANNVFSGLSAPRPSGPTHQESGNIYDEIPSHQWHKKLVSTDTVDQKTTDAIISRCSLPPVDRDNRNNKHEIITQTPADLSDEAPEDNPHILLHRQNALKPRDSTSHTLPPFDLQTNLNSLASDSSSVSSSLSSPSQRSSLPLSSEASSSYLHPVSEVSIMVDVDLDVRARQRALYQVLDCGYVDFKVYEALPKPCSPRLQRAARKMETNHNRWSQ